MFGVEKPNPDHTWHFGLIVRDERQIAEVREKLTTKYGIKFGPHFHCDFVDPFGNRVQVVDLHDESLVWLLPYQEVQEVGDRLRRRFRLAAFAARSIDDARFRRLRARLGEERIF